MTDDASKIPRSETEALAQAIETFAIYCGAVTLWFPDSSVRELILRNFIARGMICTQSIFTVWAAGSESDAWILHRCLIDRLFHLHHLAKTDGFGDFCEFSFLSMYEARHKLLSDPDMKSKVPDTLKDLQRSNKRRYDSTVTKQSRWRRPKAEDVAKEMDLAFIYSLGYDYASTYVHPMASDGEADFSTLVTPAHKRASLDATVVKNSVIVQSLLVQEALNISKMHWCAITYDFLEQIRQFLTTGDQTFQVTMCKLAAAGPDFKLCAQPTSSDEA